MRTRAWFLSFALALAPVGAVAQDNTQTLADIRQELTVLHVEIQKLRRELSTTGGPTTSVGGATALDRLNAIEGELTRLTARTEQLSNRVDNVVRDGTNRIGDLEFRLVELEGGDVSQLGETTTLGGGVLPAAGGGALAPVTPVAPVAGAATGGGSMADLAVGEAQDYQAANSAFEQGDFETAAALLQDFNTNYPGSPVAAEASLRRGLALNQMGDTREAARAFLESYTVAPSGPVAPQAVLALGSALGALGKTREACLTLAEIELRYPGTDAVAAARQEMATLGCS
ncbi:MAG: tol-pal system protein YbgF [Rhodobacteraceae bacterium]|nr:MAG: tol-pal system protein YbgF [Paracoccaceae bacterium]